MLFELPSGTLLPPLQVLVKGIPSTFPAFPRLCPTSSPLMGCGAAGDTEGDTVGETLQKEETVSSLASGGGI